MKTMIVIVFLSMLSAGSLFAQQRTDSIPSRPQQQKKRFIDENGDGVNDRKMSGARDRFIDANGDGICDTRERGLGFRRNKNLTKNSMGKQQQRGKK